MPKLCKSFLKVYEVNFCHDANPALVADLFSKGCWSVVYPQWEALVPLDVFHSSCIAFAKRLHFCLYFPRMVFTLIWLGGPEMIQHHFDVLFLPICPVSRRCFQKFHSQRSITKDWKYRNSANWTQKHHFQQNNGMNFLCQKHFQQNNGMIFEFCRER